MNIKEQIEEILLTDYQYVDCYTVQKLLDLFAVSERSEQLCPECGSNDIEAIVCGDLGCNNCGNIWA